MIKEKSFYLERFGVTETMLESVISKALSRGGNYADLFFEDTTYNDLTLRDSSVNSGGYHSDFGVGIRVLNGEKTGYAYTEDTSLPQMLAAADAASSICGPRNNCLNIDDTKASKPGFHGKPNPAADRYPVINDWTKLEASEFIPYLNNLEKRIREKDQRVTKVIAGLSSHISNVLMYNSLGELKYDSRPMGKLAVRVVFSQDGKIENKTYTRAFRMGAEMLTETLQEEIASQVTSGIDERFDARRPKGGAMKVVMGAGASGILLHEAMGHAFEADFNRKGQSVFSDKMGQRICPARINIVDDGTIKGNRGACNYDDEGIPGQRTTMVEDGILTSYLHDRISADFYGVSPTGNGRRESFRYNPLPRMRATYMESGENSKEEIISSVKKGIYVDEFSNGQVKIGEGDFTFYVKSGFLIENGKLTAPVKDINIIGNGPQALADISMVGNDLMIDDSGWTCGKGQDAPVSCGIPTVLIKKLIVGGE